MTAATRLLPIEGALKTELVSIFAACLHRYSNTIIANKVSASIFLWMIAYLSESVKRMRVFGWMATYGCDFSESIPGVSKGSWREGRNYRPCLWHGRKPKANFKIKSLALAYTYLGNRNEVNNQYQ